MNLSLRANCWFVGQQDFQQMFHSGSLVPDFRTPYAYFSRLSNTDENRLEGYVGRYDQSEEYHTEILPNFTYFNDYREGKAIYLTFDKTTLYQICEIYPSKPLLFILKRINYLRGEKLMLNQESIYQLIFNEKWRNIIDILHHHKTDIKNDPILRHAAETFEKVFIEKVKEFPETDIEIKQVLELLYLIHFGKFYTLSGESLKRLTIELAKRSPVDEAYNFAMKYPEEPDCQKIINQHQSQANSLSHRRVVPQLNNWIEIYNRLFEIINNQGDSATYFSGPRFIDAVKEFDPYFPTYSQFIQLRNNLGKSTSRKIFYYDILMDLDEIVRMKIVARILAIARPFVPEKVNAIEILLGIKQSGTSVASVAYSNIVMTNPTVFISYSWDDEKHKDWVLKLADRLTSDGIKVLLDRYDLKIGRSLPHFVEQSIAHADRILIIFTPGYKSKADQRLGGVGYEYSIVNAELYQTQTTNAKIIPVLRRGEMKDSIPAFMQQFIHLDLRKDKNFETSYADLLREIYDEPAVKRPEIGNKKVF